MSDIYPWDFREIARNFYRLQNGIYLRSGYTDCLVEASVDKDSNYNMNLIFMTSPINKPSTWYHHRYLPPLS